MPLSVIGGQAIDMLIIALHLAGLASILGGMNFMCTLHIASAPRITLFS
ncbi:MAG: hypothetical protein OEM61_11855 [Desulfobacteraceae bacterium]|nr:hypothetical protein [Desulfobacteraceae bacterium]